MKIDKDCQKIDLYHNGQEIVLMDMLWDYKNHTVSINKEAKDTGVFKKVSLDSKKIKKIENIDDITFRSGRMYIGNHLKMHVDASPFVAPDKDNYVIVALGVGFLEKAAMRSERISLVDEPGYSYTSFYLKDKILRLSQKDEDAFAVKTRYPPLMQDVTHFVAITHIAKHNMLGIVEDLGIGKNEYMWLPADKDDKTIIFSSGYNLVYIKTRNYCNNYGD